MKFPWSLNAGKMAMFTQPGTPQSFLFRALETPHNIVVGRQVGSFSGKRSAIQFALPPESDLAHNFRTNR